MSRGTPQSAIRLGVKGGGCSGYKFVIEFADNERQGDHVWNLEGVRFVIDPKSLIFLSGSTVVWRESPTQKGFDIQNPHEMSRCGCGSSFSLR